MAVFPTYSHTFPQNLEIIKTTGVYGTDMRTAIAEAIDQSDSYSDSKIAQIRSEVASQDIRMEVTPISGTTEDYLLTVVNLT